LWAGLIAGVLAAAPPALARGASPAAAGDGAATSLAFTPCRLEHTSRLRAFAAECSTLSVPEDASRPDGRRIALAVTRVPGISRSREPDPLFLIAGGPGMGTADMYTGVAAAFARIGRTRDLILVDQRGTGRSAPLGCDFDDDTLLDADEAAIRTLTQRCLAALQSKHDPRQFTTSVAVQDLDRVRRALGAERINLYGVSYGTRVAQHYLRRFPQHTRSMILDGVAPPGLALGPGIAPDAEAALARIFARCRLDGGCRRAFGDPAEHYRALRSRLDAGPVEVTLPDPRSAKPRTLKFGPRHLGAVLRLQSYSSSSAAMLPYALAAARRDADYVPLAGLFLMIEASTSDLLAYGMHNAVVCTEDLPFVDDSRIDRAQLVGTYLGVAALDGLRWICGAWPRGVLDADLRSPLQSDVPVLLLSGEDDPVTPPANGKAALRGLTRARHVVVPGSGHGQVTQPCIDKVFAQFVAAPEGVPRQDLGCLERSRPPPFFLSSAGPGS
jgi:pimeloyl-ACP methyl ester carboxylesterase